MNAEKDKKDLLAVIVIRGRSGEPHADVSIDFRPSMHEEDRTWEASGAGEAVMTCLEALRMMADYSEFMPTRLQ